MCAPSGSMKLISQLTSVKAGQRRRPGDLKPRYTCTCSADWAKQTGTVPCPGLLVQWHSAAMPFDMSTPLAMSLKL